jgi:hypothetical protein
VVSVTDSVPCVLPTFSYPLQCDCGVSCGSLGLAPSCSSIQCNIVGELISQGLLFEAETMLDATLDSVMRFRLGPNIDNVMQTVQQHKVRGDVFRLPWQRLTVNGESCCTACLASPVSRMTSTAACAGHTW